MEEERYLLDEMIDELYDDWKVAPPGSEERARISGEIEKFYSLRLKDYQAMQEANERRALERAEMKAGVLRTALELLKIALPSIVTCIVTGCVLKFEEEGVIKSKTWSWIAKRL